MYIYLPIAEISVNVFVLLGLGFGVGLLSGIFGVGGGFLTTPLLIFIGVSPAVAVATGANQIVASSVSGALAQWRRKNVDVKMGLVLLSGGAIGAIGGVWLFSFLKGTGHIDVVVQLCYVIFLGGVGGLMLFEAARTIRKRQAKGSRSARKLHEHSWLHGLPFKVRFRHSRLYISCLPPIALGIFVGVLTALMGVGGGFFLIPAMIYLLGMPTAVVVGTSLFQITFVTAITTFLQAYQNHTVDIVLAILLLTGSVVGAQVGSRWGARLAGEQVRGLLALLVMGVALKLAIDMILPPDSLYAIEIGRTS
ncbi:MAG: sulfite exporter TauE/SafE family protein [Alphaproteobacteria bacterium]|nr:sulfite exporter TauE/SafE family protein [Alphaproteobacteria bacterium]